MAKIDTKHPQTSVLTVDDLHKYYGDVKAVDGISFDIRQGEVFGLAGESGSGKTTTGRLILRLVEPTEGNILFDGVDVAALSGEDMRRMRQRVPTRSLIG